MKKDLLIPGVVVVLLLFAAVTLFYGTREDQPKELFYSGVVESEQYDLGFEVGGTLSELRVAEGDAVKAGQVLATLDKRETEKRLQAAQAHLAATQARYDEMKNGARPEDIESARARVKEATAELQRLQNGATSQELKQAFHQAESARYQAALKSNGYRDEDIEQARARLQSAKAELVAARIDFERHQALLEEGAAPQAVVDEKRRRYESAQALVRERSEALDEQKEGFRSEDVAASKEQFEAARARYEDLENGTRPELVAGAEARVERAGAELSRLQNGARSEELEASLEAVRQSEAEVARLNVILDKTEILSPADGVVSSSAFEVGETVSPGAAVVQLIVPSQTWVNVFIPEGDLARVKLGMNGRVSADSLVGDDVTGKLSYISPTSEFTPRFIQTERERVLLVYRAKVVVDDPNHALKPGMPADVQLVAP